MRYSSIRSHLKPYVIVSRRRTTINHAFAAAIAPSDSYDEKRVKEAIHVLGQNPDQDLECAYCGALAQTWDHVFATVKDSHFSGHGHRLGNLLPCCKACNSAKGNKNWRRYLEEMNRPDRIASIENYLNCYGMNDQLPEQSCAYKRLLEIRSEVLKLLTEADVLANHPRWSGLKRFIQTPDVDSIFRSSWYFFLRTPASPSRERRARAATIAGCADRRAIPVPTAVDDRSAR